MASDFRTHVSNVLVIGSGAAGLRAAIAADQAGAQVLVIGKRRRLDAHTVLASGGINSVLGTRDPEDSWQQHFADTVKEGYLLGDPRVVQILVTEAPEAIRELAEWGCPFALTDEGAIDQRFFGAHRWRRTCYAGDYTGRAVLQTLAKKTAELQIPVFEDHYISSLLVADGACFGAFGFDLHTGDRTTFLADAVVLCGGGHTRLWRRSSSRRDENFGEGMFLGLAAQAAVMDMELVQFHPTGMVAPPGMEGTLVTEAVRGEGGRLTNADGERYMERYDPDRMELSTRDRVALANYTEILEGRGGPNGGVFLDISHRDKSYIIKRLPRMYRQFIEYQMLDISEAPMEVAPTAHYSMGGLVVEPETHATDVAGLFAAGECTAGMHGANRLGGNSLSETVVFGRRAGNAAADFALSTEVTLRPKRVIAAASDQLDALIHPGTELARPIQRALRDLMWAHAGVVRDESSLQDGLSQLYGLHSVLGDIDVRYSDEGWADLAQTLDLRAGLMMAEATLKGALARTETRGCHIRSDCPALDRGFEVNLHFRLDADGHLGEPQAKEVPPIPEPLRDWVTGTEDVMLGGRLLE
ncbi:MAG: succinate dehydrogenase / fumarate reductase, flavoprotein subunit [Actinomycetota bacterium]|nr:succinate dehydrogenase / fumarate reductase, flavoprotein subunit [Actinomycetota bacterium]